MDDSRSDLSSSKTSDAMGNTGRVAAEYLGFFDDAAIFPPGLAPLDRAVAEHVARWNSVLAPAVGPLILPLQDLPEARALASAQNETGSPVRVSVVTPAGQLEAAMTAVDTVGPELVIAGIELKTSPERSQWERELIAASAVSQVPVFVEVDAQQIGDGALVSLSGTGLRLKYRTGGIEARLFPTPRHLAEVLMVSVQRQIPFKLTAGLHQAVRYTSPMTGFTHHGFLNIAVAVAAAQQGSGPGELETILGQTDGRLLVEQHRSGGGAWRKIFTSFGTCSVGEPAESLEALGLIPAGIASAG